MNMYTFTVPRQNADTKHKVDFEHRFGYIQANRVHTRKVYGEEGFQTSIIMSYC